MRKYYSADITWCDCGCKNTKCEYNIRNHDPMIRPGLLIGEYMKYHVYEPVTEHYGIVMKRSLDNDVFCVFASDTKDMKASAAVCGTLDRKRAERECRYLEAMNYGGDSNG